MNDTPKLVALLDTLMPGDGIDWPAAGAHGLADKTWEMARLQPDGEQAISTMISMLPPGFNDLPEDAREAALREIETDEPAIFGSVVSFAYNAYYTDPEVRDVIERVCGYENRPPQPLGYELPPFDESLLDQVKARGPIWRAVPDS
ncbi:MAG: hypothetical protein QNJ35_16265 [Paracoccaceae bacterium]|nr:hypothetical protein [Paracoccaceae bacterium]